MSKARGRPTGPRAASGSSRSHAPWRATAWPRRRAGLWGGGYAVVCSRGSGRVICTAQKVGAAGTIWRVARSSRARRRCDSATRRACARTPMVEGRRLELPPDTLEVVSESSPMAFRPWIGRLRWGRANEPSAMRCWATSVGDVCPGLLVNAGVEMRRILCRLSPGWPAQNEYGNTTWVRPARAACREQATLGASGRPPSERAGMRCALTTASAGPGLAPRLRLLVARIVSSAALRGAFFA